MGWKGSFDGLAKSDPISLKTLDVSNGGDFCQAKESSFDMASATAAKSNSLKFLQGDLLLLPALGAQHARHCVPVQQGAGEWGSVPFCGEENWHDMKYDDDVFPR